MKRKPMSDYARSKEQQRKKDRSLFEKIRDFLRRVTA